eukprot:GFUD01089675.1.p1 GENE.GFUD01089675.1~~GFUD01089675.1.p1  ORF type:complete len:319 (-),score=70.90 GFUD01089675.1:58-879(-)
MYQRNKKDTGPDFTVYTKMTLHNNKEQLIRLQSGTFIITEDIFSNLGSVQLEGQDDPVSNEWEYKSQSGTWKKDPLFKLTPLDNPYPNSYMVYSSGLSARKYPEFFGFYNKTKYSCYDYPVYGKPNQSQKFLRLNSEKQWTLTKTELCKGGTIMKQNLKGSPFPHTSFPWQYYDYAAIAGKYEDDDQMMVYSADKNDATETAQITNSLLAIIVISPTVVIIIIIILGLFLLIQRRQKANAQETVNENPYYGEEDYEEEYQETAVVDNNDYYAM